MPLFFLLAERPAPTLFKRLVHYSPLQKDYENLPRPNRRAVMRAKALHAKWLMDRQRDQPRASDGQFVPRVMGESQLPDLSGPERDNDGQYVGQSWPDVPEYEVKEEEPLEPPVTVARARSGRFRAFDHFSASRPRAKSGRFV